MVTFATLFLGLIAGPQNVAVTVSDDVAFVELRLDGEMLARLVPPLWADECDFGVELAPHRFEAVAFDDDGAELGRAEQILNVPHPAAEVEVIVEEGERGEGAVAQVSWGSKIRATPASWTVSFDGEPLDVLDPSRFGLPSFDPDTIHFLRVELRFAEGVVASSEAIFGGRYGTALELDLSAVPLVAPRKRLDSPTAQRSLRTHDGSPVEVAALDKGAADLVFVLGPSVRQDLTEIVARWVRQEHSTLGRIRAKTPLKADQRLRFLWSQPEVREVSALTYYLFAHSPELPRSSGGLLFHLMNVRDEPPGPGPIRLTDAVAAAGLTAAMSNNRRAVVLLLGPRPRDASQFGPVQIRRYLSRLRVPLEVWSTDPDGPDRETAWGPVVEVSSVAKLATAFRRLSKGLERQRIAWITGRYLPSEIFADEAGAVRVAGSVVVDDFHGDEQLVLPDTRERPTSNESAATEVPATVVLATVVPEPAVDEPSREARLDRALALLGDDYVEHDLGEWTLYAALDNRWAVPVFERLAPRVESAYRKRFGLTLREPVDPESIVLFDREEDYRRYIADQPELSGVVMGGHAGNGLAVLFSGNRSSEELTGLAVHELAHLLSRRVTEVPLQPWLEEGIANDLGYSQVETNGEIRLGTLAQGAGTAYTLRTPAGDIATWTGSGPRATLWFLLERRRIENGVPLGELLDLTQAEFLEGEDVQLRYATSGFLVRFLLDGEKRVYRERFLAFVERASAGGPSGRVGLEAALGVTVEELARELDSWLAFSAATLRFAQ